MSNWNKLMEDLETDGPLDQERTDELRAKVKRESELNQKKWLISLTLSCLMGLAFILYGGIVVRDSVDMRFMLLGGVFIIIGFEITVLVKLAYGNQFSMLKILAMLREVQISVLEHLNMIENAHANREIKS